MGSGRAVLTGLPERTPGDEGFLGAWLLHSISHKPHSRSQPDPNRFDRDRLFSVAAQGVPQDLAGLQEYLRATSKYLTDSEYTGRPVLRRARVLGCAGTVLVGGS